MSDINITFAGFGGQGILFMGKVTAYAGLMDGKEVSWFPSYGPEMRGGTAKCDVCISEDPISSPIVMTSDVLIAMNKPSYEKYIGKVKPGGIVITDSTMVTDIAIREDIKTFSIPATKLAEEQDLKGLANIIVLGKLFKETDFCKKESLEKGIGKSVSARKEHLLKANLKAIDLGETL
ncbi:MAG: 2-oxoacid:ferredoxin oxidoreductase subunit gamma [Clostridiales bacterium 43-6]|nr:MAG: 2-oxoacid:ferredoxin oxidoreductase subunit gamma [Clostridiales bacterium 43-6]